MEEDVGATADHVLANRVSWDADADAWVERGRVLWASDEPCWGVWSVRESELGLLPEVGGRDTVELGCGTGYVSAWLARRGARRDEDVPATEQLQRDHFGMHFDWPDAEGAVEFGLAHGDMIGLLRRSGFEIDDLVEARAPEDAEAPTDPLATAAWSRRWPIEEAWKARRIG
jgi:hypothetical protein